MSLPLSPILTTDTFRTWFTRTNDIIAAINGQVVSAGQIANGAFTVNGSLLVINTFFANSSVVNLRGNTVVSANLSINSSANVVTMSPGTLVLQPLNGTVVNSALTINTVTTFLQGFTVNANVIFNGSLTETGNLLINGGLTVNNQPIIGQQVIFGSPGGIVSPAALTSPQYDDYAPNDATSGNGQYAALWNLTPSGLDVVLTGIAAPTTLVTGARVLYVQNLSNTNKLTLAAANTSSALNNRFRTPNSTNADIPPGGSIALVWSSTNHEWRILSPSAASLPTLTVSGNSVLNALSVLGSSTFNAAVIMNSTLTVTNANVTFGNTAVNGWLNVASLLIVQGNTTLTGNATLSGFANVAGKLVVAGNTTLSGNVAISANVSLSANAAVTSTVTLTGAGRLVLPIGANLWA